MIINPARYPHLLVPYSGTRVLQQDFGLIGESVADPHDAKRVWTLEGAYGLLKGRRAQGVRFKAYDQLGFVSFIEQMALEVLLNIGKPGERCQWSGLKYPGLEDGDGLYGFAMDDDDLDDDMLDIETSARGQPGVVLPDGSFVERKLHKGQGDDFAEGWTLIWDGDPATGIYPDPRLETVGTRWQRVEQRRVRWDKEFRDSQLDGQAFNYRQWREQNSAAQHSENAKSTKSASAARRRFASLTK